MKKIFLIAILGVLIVNKAQAQLVTKPEKFKDTSQVKIKSPGQTSLKVVKVLPVETKTSAGTTVQNTNTYTLTSVRVSIRTGNDNKEFPSKVGLLLSNRGGTGFIFHQPGENLRNEMKSNSNTEFGLEKYPTATQQNLTLESIQNQGLALRIVYSPNFLADAWKIEGVTITLEFKDQNGTLHPTLGNKTITCNNANGFLDEFNHVLMCYMDGQFIPTTSSIQQ